MSAPNAIWLDRCVGLPPAQSLRDILPLGCKALTQLLPYRGRYMSKYAPFSEPIDALLRDNKDRSAKCHPPPELPETGRTVCNLYGTVQ